MARCSAWWAEQDGAKQDRCEIESETHGQDKARTRCMGAETAVLGNELPWFKTLPIDKRYEHTMTRTQFVDRHSAVVGRAGECPIASDAQHFAEERHQVDEHALRYGWQLADDLQVSNMLSRTWQKIIESMGTNREGGGMGLCPHNGHC